MVHTGGRGGHHLRKGREIRVRGREGEGEGEGEGGPRSEWRGMVSGGRWMARSKHCRRVGGWASGKADGSAIWRVDGRVAQASGVLASGALARGAGEWGAGEGCWRVRVSPLGRPLLTPPRIEHQGGGVAGNERRRCFDILL